MKDTMTSKYTPLYPWILSSNTIEEYIPPEYYHKLLKEYSFNGLTDLEYLKSFTQEVTASKALELGCGSGRASTVALKELPRAKFTLVDLSERMLKYANKRFSKRKINFHSQDALNFLASTKGQYDFVYSLWSLSHSIHQHVHQIGFKNASKLINRTLTKFIRKNIQRGGKFFLMHFDSMSQEQRVLMRQWKRVFPEFSDLTQQSPSKRILDSVLHNLDNRDEIILSTKHLRGDPILYSSEDEVLEIFLNFHMETYFNHSEKLTTVLHDIKKNILPYRQKDGTYKIQPGCYIYSFEKV